MDCIWTPTFMPSEPILLGMGVCLQYIKSMDSNIPTATLHDEPGFPDLESKGQRTAWLSTNTLWRTTTGSELLPNCPDLPFLVL